MPRSRAQAIKYAFTEREARLTQAMSHRREHPETTYWGVALLFGLNKETIKDHLEGYTMTFNQGYPKEKKFHPEKSFLQAGRDPKNRGPRPFFPLHST